MSLGHHLRNWRFSWGSASNDLGLLPYARRFFISLPCGRSVSNEMHMIESIAVCSPNDKARLPLDSRSRHAIQYCSISRLTGDALETHREGGKKKNLASEFWPLTNAAALNRRVSSTSSLAPRLFRPPVGTGGVDKTPTWAAESELEATSR